MKMMVFVAPVADELIFSLDLMRAHEFVIDLKWSGCDPVYIDLKKDVCKWTSVCNNMNQKSAKYIISVLVANLMKEPN